MKALAAEGATPALNILRIDASGRVDGSSTRELTARVVEVLTASAGRVTVSRRDVARGIPFVDDAWVDAAFTPAEARSDRQHAALSVSDALVREVLSADVLVIGVPSYNFGVPAALKAWIDMVARAGVTFRHTADGPIGLLEGKKAYVVFASGGVPVDSSTDFATPWLRHVLGFIGITDVKVIAADQQVIAGEAALDNARAQIDALGFAGATLPRDSRLTSTAH